MSDTTPNLTLPYIVAAQAQKHVTHSEAIRMLDALLQIAVVDRLTSISACGASTTRTILTAASGCAPTS
jgi:hypothetical protein